MSERERWIVYPLLFLALGASLRDKLAKQTRSQQIVCEELYVVNNQGRPVARLTEGSFILESSKNGPGTIKADVMQTNALIQQGRQVGQLVTWQNLIPLFQQMGLIRVTPNQLVPVVPQPLKEMPPQAAAAPNQDPTQDSSPAPSKMEPVESEPPKQEASEAAAPALVAPSQPSGPPSTK